VGRKPIWSEGQFVSQHHFQAQDRYHEGRLHGRLGALRRFGWGISRLEIDEHLLQNGQFGLRRLAGIWPDGLAIDCGPSPAEPPPAPRPFEDHFRDGAPTLDVFVGVSHDGAQNLPEPSQAPSFHRFSRLSAPVNDFNAGGSTQDLEFAIPNPRIVFGDERRDGVGAVPIAKLVRTAEGRVGLHETFVPPILDLAASPYLTRELRRVLGAITARHRELAQGRKQRNASNVEFHFADARRFMLLNTLGTSMASLTHFADLLESDPVHPEELYLKVVELIASLSAFSADVDPVNLPKFDFFSLGEVFEALYARVIALLSVDAAPTYTEIPLERRPDGMFVGRIPEPRLANHEFFVAVRSTMPEAALREQVPQLLKVAGWKRISEIVKQARHGVRVEVEWSPSSALPIKPGLSFFRVRREGAFWDDIATSKTLALYLPHDGEWKETWVSVYALDPSFAQ
jgi:type VI secretion system protein ImpJ